MPETTRIQNDTRFAAAMNRLCNFLNKQNNCKIGFYGAGKHSADMLESFKGKKFLGKNTLECFITDQPGADETFKGYPVLPPQTACKRCHVIVLSTDSFEAQMLTNIEQCGFTGQILVLYGQSLCLANVGMNIDELAQACGKKINRTKYLLSTSVLPTDNKLTIFTSAKPFTGPFARIQERAIQSWLRLPARPDIILMGNEEGYQNICSKYGLTHIKDIPHNQNNTPLLNGMFSVAEKMATTNTLAYINADMILMDDFIEGISSVREKFSRFLIIGQRYDLDMPDNFSFEDEKHNTTLTNLVNKNARLHAASGIDYFVYNKPTLWPDMPEFALGRCAFDNWLVHTAIADSIPVVDASRKITAIHQNHDYSHFKANPHATLKTIQGSKEAKHNIELAGKNMVMGSIGCAPFVLSPEGIKERNIIGEF